VNGWILDRNQVLDPAIEVAGHPVGGREVDFRVGRRQIMPRADANDSAMLQEASDQALYRDVLRKPRNARSQAADSSHDQTDLNARP
jgi:hypothetical protein